MAPKPTGSLVVLVGLERVPCKVYPAVLEAPRVSFTTICSEHGAKVETVQRCATSQKVIPKDATEGDTLSKGYELGKGRFLSLSEAELAEVQPEPDPEIEVKAILELADIDPIAYCGTPRFLGPDVGTGPVIDMAAARAFESLVQALREASDGEGAVAVGRWATRGADKLVAIGSRSGRLMMIELRRAGELRDIAEIEVIAGAKPGALEKLEPILRRLRVETLDLSAFPDERYDATVKLLQAKAEKAAARGPHRDAGPKMRPKRASK